LLFTQDDVSSSHGLSSSQMGNSLFLKSIPSSILNFESALSALVDFTLSQLINLSALA
jgi:hypothetical protein